MSHAQHDDCRVVDRDSPGLRQGIARELRKHVAILEREIAELEPADPTLLAAIAAAEPWHGARAEKAAGHLGSARLLNWSGRD